MSVEFIPAMFRIRSAPFLFYNTMLIGAALLLVPSLYNGYPLINSDDGTYIHSGFIPFIPDDRPIVYGLLLRIFSLNGVSLWLAVISQAIVVSWLLLKIIFKNVHYKKYLVAIIIYTLLAFCTSLSWITSEIIPDVCTPIVLMAMYVLLIGGESKLNYVLLCAVFLVASGTHMSHFMIFMGVMVLIFLFRKSFFSKEQLKYVVKTLGILVLLSVVATVVNSSVYSKSKHVFLMGAMLDKGILKTYLDDNCRKNNYKLCKHKDSLGTDPNWFLWDSYSPLYEEGGWAATKTEYSSIINDVFSTPKYLAMFAKSSVKDSWRQLLDFKIGDGNFPFKTGSHVYYAVKNHVPNDEHAYVNAWQHQELIIPELAIPNKIIYAVVIVSAIILALIILFKRKSLSLSVSFFIFLSIILIIINVWNCATFAQVNGRYSCRVMWLLPFCAMLCLAQPVFLNKKSSNKV